MKRKKKWDEDRMLSMFVRFFVPFVLVSVLASMVAHLGLVNTLLLLVILLGRSMLSPAFWVNCSLVAVSLRESRGTGQ